MKLKFQPATHGKDKNRYCGPAVISCLTGMTTGEAARLIRSVTGRASVKGTHSYELKDALRRCGVEMKPLPVAGVVANKRPTLAAWLRATKDLRRPGLVLLVSAGHHWQLISGRRYVCGRLAEVVSVRDARVKRRARVRAVYTVKSDKVTIPDCCRKRGPSAEQRAIAAQRREAVALAGKHDIDVERDGDTIWVYGPAHVYGHIEDWVRPDLFEDNHACAGWGEALEHVKGYVKDIAEHERALAEGKVVVS